MGLLYPFPVEQSGCEVDDHVTIHNSTLSLRTYGLPYLFWGYLLCLLTTIGLVALISWEPLKKMLLSQDPLNSFIAWTTLITLVATPLGFSCFFFMEFRLQKKKSSLIKSLHLCGLPLSRRHFQLRDSTAFTVEAFEGTPNRAKKDHLPGSERHQNKGYYQLYLHTQQGDKVLLDRHSRKVDLVKLQELLSKF